MLDVLACIEASHVDIFRELSGAVRGDFCDLRLLGRREWRFESDVGDELFCEGSSWVEQLGWCVASNA